MLEVLKSLKNIIEKFIINRQSITETASAGSTTLKIGSTRRFNAGDKVVVLELTPDYGEPACELHTVAEIIDKETMTIETALSSDYSTDCFVQKLIGTDPSEGDFVKHVFLGDPPVIRTFPAITVDAKNQDAEWMTLESVQDQFGVDITVYVTQDNYESQYEMMHHYVKAIRYALFRSLYPLVEPYRSTTLVEDFAADATDFKVEDEEIFLNSWGIVFFENACQLRVARVESYLGSGVYRLNVPLGREFEAGDSVILPLRHIFNTIPHSVNFGTVNKEGTMLKASVISWRGLEEMRIGAPYIDPMLF